MEIYDLIGRNVKTLVIDQQEPGHFQIIWDGTDNNNLSVVAGVYFCRLEIIEYSSGSTGSQQASLNRVGSRSSEQSFVKMIKVAIVK